MADERFPTAQLPHSPFSLAPPTRPDKFNTREELKRYLQLVSVTERFYHHTAKRKITRYVQVHEYYAIIGRPRFGRSSVDFPPLDANIQYLFRSFDLDGDQVISYDEFQHQLRQ